jgi:hypothetical protein
MALFQPRTTTTIYKETISGGEGTDPAIQILYSVNDFDNYEDWPEDVGFVINPKLVDPRLANKDFTEPILAKLNTNYNPLHSRGYTITHPDAVRFWWQPYYYKTPFMSRLYLRDLVGFAEHKHDPAFVQQLCQELNEEAMNVIKEIKTLIAELDNKSSNPV